MRYFGRVFTRRGRRVRIVRRKAACVKEPVASESRLSLMKREFHRLLNIKTHSDPDLCSRVRCGRFKRCVTRRVGRSRRLVARCIRPKPIGESLEFSLSIHSGFYIQSLSSLSLSKILIIVFNTSIRRLKSKFRTGSLERNKFSRKDLPK